MISALRLEFFSVAFLRGLRLMMVTSSELHTFILVGLYLNLTLFQGYSVAGNVKMNTGVSFPFL